jgi:hypothetical protein
MSEIVSTDMQDEIDIENLIRREQAKLEALREQSDAKQATARRAPQQLQSTKRQRLG